MIRHLIDVAAGREKADLVLKNGSYVNVFSGTVEKGDIAFAAGKIVGVGEYSGRENVDIAGMVALPGLIDGHVHIESSQLTPEEFARLIVPRGTTCVIADPHEIVNVCGMAGVEYMARAAEGLPLDVKIQLPSCVPATPFETSGATLGAREIAENIPRKEIFGLGEFMNYPGVIGADAEALGKLRAAAACGKIVDGHAPGLSGKALNAYIAAGISTDHECLTPEEAAQKVSRGMYCHLRHGSATRNLAANARAVNENNMRRFLLCTDDRHAADLKNKGHLDDALRTLCKSGFDPVRAVILATLNAAECYGLKGKGAIAPGYCADVVVMDGLTDFNAKYVFKDGKLVAADGKALFRVPPRLPDSVLRTVHLSARLRAEDFRLPLSGNRARVMRVQPGGIVTESVVRTVSSRGGDVEVKGTDLLKLAVVERHKGTGNIGRGLLEGYGFRGGCLGITVSHDSHNIILLGDDNADMALAANALADMGGGMVIARGGTWEGVPLAVGGLMSDEPAERFIEKSERLAEKAYAMGVREGLDAFLSLAFLSLAVVPQLKLLDTGLFDVDRFSFTDIDADKP